ncbi:MAG: HepT-like ribonuclease domain-containing protein [Methanosarcinales archaeon]
MNEANGLRNRLVHEYNRLNDEVALEAIQYLLEPIENFVEAVQKWMKTTE